MKTIMRNGKGIRRGVSLLLMVSLLITLLPVVSVAETTVGAYGSVTVTTKNVVIRTSPAGSRTGYFAQKGTYPMIGPAFEVDGVMWYNLQTSETGGFVSGNYAIPNYGSAGMPPTEKTYVDILATTEIILGEDPANPLPDSITPTKINVAKGNILQLVGNYYSKTVGSVTSNYINLYYYDSVSDTYAIYHTLYTTDFAKGIMTTDNLNNHISEVTWKAPTTGLYRDGDARGDYLTHALQAALSILDYYEYDVDGFYGILTKSAVTEFREDNSITPLTNDDANAEVFQKAFEQATDRIQYLRSTPGLSGDTDGSTTTAMIQTTIEKLRIRKSASTSSVYVGMIEAAGTILTYTRTQLNGTVTWYYIQYQGTYGWVMGTYVTPYSTGTTTPSTITNYGTVTITKKLTAIRKTPNGSRTGYHVNTGDVCTMIGPSVEAGGYTWYNIRTESGRTGYVRGDCATPDFGSAGMPSSDKNYVQFLYAGMQIRKGSNPASPDEITWVTLPKDTVLQLKTGSAYSSGGVNYINVYYNNAEYHTEYTTNLTAGLMSEDNVNSYIANVVWAQALGPADVAALSTTTGATIYLSDIRVQAIQAALYQLDLYSDKYDGIFGNKTAAGVIKFKENNSIVTPSDEKVNDTVSIELFTQAKAALQVKLTTVPDTGDGTVPSAGIFGTVNTVKKGSWAEIDGGARSLFPKGSVATVMSVANPTKIFRIYRWSGANHADCVPYDATDTATLASIVGFTSYTSSHPTTSQLSQIKADGNDDYPLYTWPAFRGGFAGFTAISGSKEKIPVWVNLNGTVYCASIYTIPHGYNGTSGFSQSKLNGQYFYDRNNMYGMLCVHFYGSTTHGSGTVNATHMANVNTAYYAAASQFGASKVK
ncbi:MAG: peptidoglycan-binding domain-containing protein [Bacillota bacterium]